jgi:hypothetical protein
LLVLGGGSNLVLPERVAGLADGDVAASVRAVLDRLAPGLAAHEPLVAAVLDQARALEFLAA